MKYEVIFCLYILSASSATWNSSKIFLANKICIWLIWITNTAHSSAISCRQNSCTPHILILSAGPFSKFCSVTNFKSTVVEDASWVIIFIDFTYDVMFMKLQTTLTFVLVVTLQTCPKTTVSIARQCMQLCNLPPTYPCVKGRRQLSARHFTRISSFFVMFHYKHL